jgi:hypothetical protein
MNQPVPVEKIEGLIEELRKVPQVQMPTCHWLLEGMYCRQILIPEGTVFVGRVHKKPHYFMCLKGSAAISTEDGLQEIRAGNVLMAPPGMKRIGITHEDTIFVTVHRTEATNMQDIADDLVEFDLRGRYGVNNEILPLLLKENLS